MYKTLSRNHINEQFLKKYVKKYVLYETKMLCECYMYVDTAFPLIKFALEYNISSPTIKQGSVKEGSHIHSRAPVAKTMHAISYKSM